MAISDDLIIRAKHYPKQKELGQNFLVDSSKLDAIVLASDLDSQRDIVVEIGPGIGFLTERLVKKVNKLFAVELDANAVTSLNILKANNKNSNIPYQISSKILLHLLGEMGSESANKDLISEINILVQKEFAERLCAKPGTKAYGAITLLMNYWAEVTPMVEIPKECFRPVPKVDSRFIKIKLRPKPLIETNNPKQLRRFIKAIFSNRRKILINSLIAAGYTNEQIELLNLPDKLRGETLNLIEIAKYVSILYP
jgi:16S rRNA (adenine1518-N6/adenine1519-N6)-dimethyltransferase